MVQFIWLMNTTDPQVLPAPPSLMKALMAGFDAISNHVGLIIFPVVLDLFLWLGPHIQIFSLIRSFFNQAGILQEMQAPETADMMKATRDAWLGLAEHFNLLSLLRSYPVGIPSLMVTRAPVSGPNGGPVVWEASSWLLVIGLWVVLSLIGLLAGSYYFSLVGQAALNHEVQWGLSLQQWPWTALQVILLALFWLALLIGVSIPFSCLLSLAFVAGAGVGGFGFLIFGGLLAWLLFPLVFSPHGIFVYRQKMWASVKEGVRLTRLTLPSTGLFLLIVLLLSEGLDLLWEVPAESSWFSLVGVAGHAFITTGLLAASFVYYRDADRWVHRMLQQAKMSS